MMVLNQLCLLCLCKLCVTHLHTKYCNFVTVSIKINNSEMFIWVGNCSDTMLIVWSKCGEPLCFLVANLHKRSLTCKKLGQLSSFQYHPG
jgi:hypothetical protein